MGQRGGSEGRVAAAGHTFLLVAFIFKIYIFILYFCLFFLQLPKMKKTKENISN